MDSSARPFAGEMRHGRRLLASGCPVAPPSRRGIFPRTDRRSQTIRRIPTTRGRRCWIRRRSSWTWTVVEANIDGDGDAMRAAAWRSGRTPRRTRASSRPGASRRGCGRPHGRHDRRGGGLRRPAGSTTSSSRIRVRRSGAKADRLRAARGAMRRCPSAFDSVAGAAASSPAVRGVAPTTAAGARDRLGRRTGPGVAPAEPASWPRGGGARATSGVEVTASSRTAAMGTRGPRRGPAAADQEVAALGRAAADRWHAAGSTPPCVSAGSTPTALRSAHGAVTEERPGHLRLRRRASRSGLGSMAADAVALTVAATVVSAGRATGSSSTPGPRSWPRTSRRSSPGHGAILGWPEARLVRVNDHHGVVELADGGAAAGGRRRSSSIMPEPRLPGGQPRRRARRGPAAGRGRRPLAGRRPRAQRLIGRSGDGRAASAGRSSRTAGDRAIRTRDRAGSRQRDRCAPFARAVDDGRRRPAVRRAAVDDEVDGVADLGGDLGRIARLGLTGPIGRGRRQRPDGRGERPGSGVVGDAQADRRGAAGQGRRQGDIRPLRDDRRSARRARRRRRAPRRPVSSTPICGRLGGVGEQQHDPLVGRSPLHVEQALDAARRRRARRATP